MRIQEDLKANDYGQEIILPRQKQKLLKETAVKKHD